MRTYTPIKDIIFHPVYYFKKIFSAYYAGDIKKTAEILNSPYEFYAGSFLGKTNFFMYWPKIFIKDYGCIHAPSFRFIPKKDVDRIKKICAVYQRQLKDIEKENNLLRYELNRVLNHRKKEKQNENHTVND